MQPFPQSYAVGVIIAFLAMLFFGVTNIFYKRMSDDISVMDIMYTRMWISLPVAYIFAVATSGSISFTVPLHSLFPLILSMVVGIMIGDGMYFYSQERIGVARAFPIAMSYPLLVYLLAALFLGEPVIPQRVVGAFIVVSGVIMIARAEQDESRVNERWNKSDLERGVVVAFLVLVCWATSDVVFQFGLIGVAPAEANFYRILAASLILVPVFLFSLKGRKTYPSRKTIGLASLIGIVALGFSLIAYSFAIKYIGATVTSLIVASGPMFTAPLSVVYLDEDVNRNVAFGTMLTIIGVLMVIVIF
ncbi:MAG: EamA family transporter [Candidatus Thorarchaeota archaeon]|nr:EamA family transporter [Candidatus Thorarchaeota archaeon]